MVANSRDERGLVYQQRGPADDSLPAHDCGHVWCGVPGAQSPRHVIRLMSDDTGPVRFCSWGCLGRYAARMELRA